MNLSDKSWKRSPNKPAAHQAIGQLQVSEPKTATSFAARTDAADERLRELTLSVAALEARVGGLVEDFRGRIEGTIQAFQGKSARQAKDLEKIAQLLGERTIRQFKEQAEVGVERIREELKHSAGILEESKQQLTSLAEAKLAALSQASREEYARQLAQAFREHTRAMHEPAQVEGETVDQAAGQPVAQPEVAERQRETGFVAQAEDAEARLTKVSSAVEALEGRVGTLVEDFQARIESTLQALQEKGAKQAEDAEQQGETGFLAQAEAAEARLTKVSSAVEALEGRVGTLAEDFQARTESTLQALQGKGAKQTEDLEKIAQELGGRWSQQFQEQAEAAAERLREELKNSARVVEEGKQQLASLAGEKLASFSQAAREEYSQQLAQASREHAQVMHEAANAQAESVKLAAERAMAQLGVAEQTRETGFSAQAEAAEERLRGVSLTLDALEGRVGALVKDFQGRIESTLQAFQWKGARQAEDLERIAEDLGKRMSQQFQAQADTAAERLEVAEQQRETGFVAQAEAAEARLTKASSALEALEGRVGSLVEDFQARIESALQAFHWKGARQAEDLEKIAQDLGGRCSQQFQEQAEAAVERLREELKNSAQAVEESKQQLASLAEEKLASLGQAAREEYAQQLAQASREHAQVVHQAAHVEVESIKHAAEQALAQLGVAEQQRETGFAAQAEAAETRLTKVSSALEALEVRVGTLVEDFQAQTESTLQALQWKGARQAEDLEKIAQDLGGRWSQQFQEQAKAAMKRLREELKSSARVVEESKEQLVSSAEAKVASLTQAAQEEYGQQLARTFGEHAQVLHEAAKEKVEAIKQTAEQSIAQLEVAQHKRETGFVAQADASEARLAKVFSAVEALEGRVGTLAADVRGRVEGTLQELQGKGAKQAEDLEKTAADLGRRWTQQFQELAEVAARKLREEVVNSTRLMDESKQQLASLAKSKLALISQVADNAVAGLEADQKRLKSQYETSRKELEDRLGMGWQRLPSPSFEEEDQAEPRGIFVRLALVAGACLVMMVPLLGVYLSTRPVMQLQPEAPAEFIDQGLNWSAKRRAREEQVGQAYWQVAVTSLQESYPFGSELPVEPPAEFQIDNKNVAPGSAKALAETRARYWEKLRQSWLEPQSWVEHREWNMHWTGRLRQIWHRLLSHI